MSEPRATEIALSTVLPTPNVLCPPVVPTAVHGGAPPSPSTSDDSVVITGASAPGPIINRSAALAAATPAATATAATTDSSAVPGPISLTPTQLAQLYNYPKDYDGTGQTIAILAFNGSGFSDDDVTQYFQSQGIPKPDVRTVSVDGGQNTPPSNNTGELPTDIKVAGAMAPGARIVVYFTQPTPKGYADAMRTIMNDKENNPTSVSISYAEGEQLWSKDPEFKDVESTFQEAAAKGINVFVSSGDNGNMGALPGEAQQVTFPASSPYVIAVGGTGVLGTRNGSPQEAGWNDKVNKWSSGGGTSDVFDRPSWQTGIAAPGGRAVPDVSADAAFVNIGTIQQPAYESGTSVSAPAWAALSARLNQAMGGQLGFLGPQLYLPGVRATMNDVTTGNNTMPDTPNNPGSSAGPGWDGVTGLGTPNGEALLAALKASRTTAAAPRLRMMAANAVAVPPGQQKSA